MKKEKSNGKKMGQLVKAVHNYWTGLNYWTPLKIEVQHNTSIRGHTGAYT